LKAYLKSEGFRCVDLGPYEKTPSVDYNDYARQLGTIVQAKEGEWGILICGTGMGMSIVANKIPGVRAALVHNMETALKSREHNDTNVLCLGAWINDEAHNLELAKAWLEQRFGEFRHVRRVERIAPQPQRKIIFANGVFDILHSGHIQMLKFAKSLGEYLVVGLNSDRSARELKGSDRPINSEMDRKAVLESLKYVDEVLVFDEPTVSNLINELQPHIVVKGGEWTAEEVRRRDKIPPNIEVKVFPLVANYSSTLVIQHIKNQ